MENEKNQAKENTMGTLKSNVPELLRERGMTPMDLVRLGLPFNTAYRAARGETDFRMSTAAKLCDAFGVSTLDEVVKYIKDSEH